MENMLEICHFKLTGNIDELIYTLLATIPHLSQVWIDVIVNKMFTCKYNTSVLGMNNIGQ